MEEFMRLFSPRDILLHMLNVAVLFIAIRLLLYKPIRKFMDARAQRVADGLADAEARQKAADGRAEQLEAEARQAQIDAAQAVAGGVQQGQQTAGEIVERAQAQAGAILEQARAEAGRIREEAGEAADARAVGLAVEIAGALLEREVKPEDHARIIEQFLTKVG